MDNRVEPVDADGDEHEGRRGRDQLLTESDELARRRRRPELDRESDLGQFLRQGERHDDDGEKEVGCRQRDDEVVGGGLETATAVDHNADEDVADHRQAEERQQSRHLENRSRRRRRRRMHFRFRSERQPRDVPVRRHLHRDFELT